jgi:hypothetical protein
VEKLSALVLDYQLDSVFLHDWFTTCQTWTTQLDKRTTDQNNILFQKNAELQKKLDVLRTLNERYEKDRRIMFGVLGALSAITFGVFVCMMAMALNLL